MQKDMTKIISLFENNYKKRKSYVSFQKISNAKDITYEEANIVFNNPKIFFPASKSRIILVHWIMKTVREIFEKYEFSDIEIPTETYDKVRDKFDTKAFNRNEFRRLFDCEKKSHLTYERFIELEKEYIEAYNQVVSDDLKLSHITHISIKKEEPKADLAKEFKEFVKNTKTKQVLLERYNGKTLDEIGLLLNLTRERIRQIEVKPRMLITNWINANTELILEEWCNNIVLKNDKTIEILGEENYNILKYVLKTTTEKNNNWLYIDAIDTIIYDKNNTFKQTLNNILTNLKEKESSPIEEGFLIPIKNAGFGCINKTMAKKILELNNFNVFDNSIHYGKMTITKAIYLTAKEVPLKGVKITDKNSLEEFAKKINRTYDLNVKANRALSTRIQDILIMTDKATYGSVDNVSVTDEIIEKIAKYINSMKNTRIPYSSLYKIFKDELNQNTTIDNHYALHGVLREFEDKNDYVCLRYYVCKKEITDIKSAAYFEKLPLLLKEKGILTIEEIIKEIPDWNDMYVKYATFYYPQVVQWEKDTYINLDIINVTEEEKVLLDEIMKKSLDNKYKYTSAYIIYDRVVKSLPEFIKRNNIENDRQLFNIIQYYYMDKYQFRKPHILDAKDVKENFTTDDLIKLIAGRTKIVDKKEILRELEKYYGEKNSSVSLSLQRVLANYIRINKHEYIAKTRIKLTEEDKAKIKKCLDDNLLYDNIILLERFNSFKELPDLGFRWNGWSLCAIINEYDLGYRKTTSANNVSVHSAVPLVPNESKLRTKEDVVRYLVENEYKGEKTKVLIARYVRNLEFFSAILITNEFIESLL